MKRREFLGFFLIGGLISLFRKALPFPKRESPIYKEAKFWRRTV